MAISLCLGWRIWLIFSYYFQVLKKDVNYKYSREARLQLKAYSFPVMMMVSLPNGTIIHAANANTFLDKSDGEITESPSFSEFVENG